MVHSGVSSVIWWMAHRCGNCNLAINVKNSGGWSFISEHSLNLLRILGTDWRDDMAALSSAGVGSYLVTALAVLATIIQASFLGGHATQQPQL